MEEVKDYIIKVLPLISPERQNALLEKLEDLGVSEKADLKWLEDKDLMPVLKVVEVRKFIALWKQKDNQLPSCSGTDSVISTCDESLSVSSDENLSSASKKDVSEGFNTQVTAKDVNWPYKFIVPWSKMPLELMETLDGNKRPSPKLRRQMVRIITSAIHKLYERPNKSQLSIIANKIVDKHPSLGDMFCGDVVAGGSATLLKQMQGRIENLNRGSAFNIMKRKLKMDECYEESDKRKNIDFSYSYGCLNWQPSKLPTGETLNTQVQKKEELKAMFLNGQKPVNVILMRKLLRDTYFTQRRNINSGLGITYLLSEWPLLFHKEGLLCHFEELMGINIITKLDNILSEKAISILKFLTTNPLGGDKKRLESVMDELENEMFSLKDTTNCVALLFLLMAYFGETVDALFMLVHGTLLSRDVEDMKTLPTTPCLVIGGDSLYSGSLFMLSVDAKVVNDEIRSFNDGLALLFAAFYCFNIRYPRKAAATLEFIQRCFLGINPDRGSKVERSSKKRPLVINRKVLNLLNGISDYEWGVR